MKGTEVLQKQVRSTGRKFLGRYYSGGHCDGLNSIFFSGLHVIRVVPNKRYSGIPMDQSLPPGMLQRDTEQARPAGGHFRESAELKEFSQTGPFHFLPADASQVACHQPRGDGAPLQLLKQRSDSGAYLVFQVRTSADVDILGMPDYLRHLFADNGSAYAGVPEHYRQNIPVQHALGGNLVVVGFETSGSTNRPDQSLAVMRAGLTDQRPIDVKQY